MLCHQVLFPEKTVQAQFEIFYYLLRVLKNLHQVLTVSLRKCNNKIPYGATVYETMLKFSNYSISNFHSQKCQRCVKGDLLTLACRKIQSKSNNQVYQWVGMLGTSILKVETIAATFLIVRFLSFISKVGLFYYKKLQFLRAWVFIV